MIGIRALSKVKIMKKRIIFPVILFLSPILSYSQNDFKPGCITTTSTGRLNGSIKEVFRSKGGITFLDSAGNKKFYEPSGLQGFTIDTVNFLSYSNDFYREIVSGPKARLYQKLTDNCAKLLYNGNEAVGFASATEGKIGDYYLFLTGTTELKLVTKRNFEQNLTDLARENKHLLTQMKDGRLGFAQIRQVIELVNN